MDQQVSENVASLKAALSAVQAAAAQYPSDTEDENWDAPANRLSHVIMCLKDIIKGEWLNAQVFGSAAESMADWPAGAEALKTAFLGVIETLKPLAESEPVEGVTGAIEEVIAALEATFTEAERKALAKSGEALPDGSFPIRNVEDLKNAIQAFGRAGNKEAAKEHIMKRARALGHADMIPEGWTSKESVTHFVGGGFFITEGTNPAKNQYRMLVIKEGLSGNRNLWKGPVLKASVGLLEGRPIYLNHSQGAHEGKPQPRSIADKVGWWSDATYVEGLAMGEQAAPVNGIVATANLLENSAHPWLPGMIKEALEKGQPNVIGVSIDAPVSGTIRRGADNQLFRDIESINAYNSADIVAEPGAGGRPLAVLEGLYSDEEIMELENLTEEQLRETNPDLVDRIVAAAREGYAPAPTQTETPPPPPAPDAQVTEAISRLDEATRIMNLRNQALVLETKLGNTGLPQAVRDIVKAEIGESLVTEAQMDEIIDRYVKVGQAVASESVLTSATVIPFRGASVMEGQIGPLDQVVAALDHWFGNPNPAMEGKFHPIMSIKQFYMDVTGDRSGGVDGVYNAKESVIGRFLGMNALEALPGATHIVGGTTITLPNLFGTSMNRALTKKYQAQNLWWRPIVDIVRLDNFKQQDRVRLHSFGSLTQRSNGSEEYTELDWNETNETYTPTGYGNVVPVNRRAFINDDLEGLRRIPTLLGESAGYTINEAVAALFTANSGNGPTLTDGVQVFNAASHQGNRLTSALDRTSLTSAIKVAASMTNDAGKRIGWRMRHLLVPIDLADTGFELINSVQAPGSANNEPNFIRSPWGVDDMIVVPQFTDTNNWYGMPDPSDIVNIEVGFILGRQDPEFFIQNGPTEGIMFTNDVINFKVRHEYGMDWLDYRGAVGSIVA